LCGLPTTCTIWRDKSKQGRIGNHKDLAVWVKWQLWR
jgi:hypothetical protein